VKALLGRKVGMTQLFDEAGRLVPVTVLTVGPCYVTQTKNPPKDNCRAVQIGFEDAKPKKVPRPQKGHFSKSGVSPKKVLRDVEPEEGEELVPGQRLGVEVFEGVSHVDVTGVSKGRGFAGVVRRHGFGGGPATHGSKTHRHPGSIGPGSSPGRVIKGRRMAGHMGAVQVTVKNLEVLRIEPERNLMLVKGAVPGSRGSCLMVKKARSAPTAS